MESLYSATPELFALFRQSLPNLIAHRGLLTGSRMPRWVNLESERDAEKVDLLGKIENVNKDALSPLYAMRSELKSTITPGVPQKKDQSKFEELAKLGDRISKTWKASGIPLWRERLVKLPAQKNQDRINEKLDQLKTIFPGQDISTLVPLFSQSAVNAMRQTKLEPQHGEDGTTADERFGSELVDIVMKLAVDYLSAYELFEEHKEGFLGAYPRALAFNEITKAVSWEKVRKQMIKALKEAFPQRYASGHVWIYNEALAIGMLLAEQSRPNIASSDGLAFEAKCEEILKRAGFTVEKTPVSGDFGVDLLARKDGLTYAIQCKFYSTPVGVSAVQEAAAGCLHYVADCAVVVALSGFTAAARRLAGSNAVLLIGATQLAELQRLCLPLIG
jgi:hypothetical protein